jgi:acetyl esterase/lipase
MGRLLFGVLAVAVSAMTVIRPPARAFWLVSLIVTEWGYWFIFPLLLLWLPGWREKTTRLIGAFLGLVACGLLLKPVLQAVSLARHLPAQLTAAFGDGTLPEPKPAAPKPSAFVLTELLTGVQTPEVLMRTVVYSLREGTELGMDVYYSSDSSLAAVVNGAVSTKAPCVVVLHGGSWQAGDRTEQSRFNAYLAARGYVVAAVDYRLAPQWRFPAAKDDVTDAISYLKTHAAEFGIDPGRLVLVGRSAGGQLAFLTAYTSGDSAIKGAVASHAPTDLSYAYQNPGNPAVIDTRGLLRAYIGMSLDDAPALYEAASPVNAVVTRTVPTLLIHGQRDELVSPAQSARLAAKLAQTGSPHLYIRLPWATHDCDVNFNGPCGQISIYAIERFLAAVLR